MKEIKFRGKSKDTNKWVYGGYFKDGKEHFIVSGEGGSLRAISVIPETVGQYTSMNDKNDKEIYEGDIVHFRNKTWQVVFYDGAFLLKDVFNICTEYLKHEYTYWSKIEVIGNIYKNSELLK